MDRETSSPAGGLEHILCGMGLLPCLGLPQWLRRLLVHYGGPPSVPQGFHQGQGLPPLSGVPSPARVDSESLCGCSSLHGPPLSLWLGPLSMVRGAHSPLWVAASRGPPQWPSWPRTSSWAGALSMAKRVPSPAQGVGDHLPGLRLPPWP